MRKQSSRIQPLVIWPISCCWLAMLMFASAQTTSAQEAASFTERRERMVRTQLQSRIFGRSPIESASVLDAMRTVPRHRFVPPEMVQHAYTDSPLPIGHDQTISQPYIVAVMTDLLEPEAGDKVLEIGTGSGYQAAVLAEIVAEVYTIEIVKPLGERAAKTFDELGYENIHTRIGDGYKGWPKHAPFDAIIVTAAPDHIPQPLVEQLKPGGRMVIPVGPEGRIQQLKLIEKDLENNVSETFIESVRFVPLTRDEETEREPASAR